MIDHAIEPADHRIGVGAMDRAAILAEKRAAQGFQRLGQPPILLPPICPAQVRPKFGNA